MSVEVSHLLSVLLPIINKSPAPSLVLCGFPPLPLNCWAVYTPTKLVKSKGHTDSTSQSSCLKPYFQCLLNIEVVAFVVVLRRTWLQKTLTISDSLYDASELYEVYWIANAVKHLHHLGGDYVKAVFRLPKIISHLI